MLRRASVFVAIVCLLSVSVGVASATTYTITDLGNLGAGTAGTMAPSAVARVGGNVEVVGQGTTTSQFYYDGFYWTQGSGLVDFGAAVSSLCGIPWGGASPTATTLGFAASGINASGQIVGTYGINSDNGTGGGNGANNLGGFSYTIGNSAVDMKCAGTSFEGVGGVNSSGQVAVTLAQGISLNFPAGIAYANGTTACTNLGAGANGAIDAYAINDSGVVAGWGALNNTYNEFAVYQGGAWHDLGSLAGKTSVLRAIDANGDVVGESPNSSNKKMPVYVPNTGGATWGSFVNLFTAGSNASGTFTAGYATGFADGSGIVGYQYVSSVPTTSSAYIWTNSTAASGVPLSSLVTNLGTWNLQEATAADSSGDIVGEGVAPNGAIDAFLLTPTVTPEPSTLLLTISGLVGLLAYAWRKRK